MASLWFPRCAILLAALVCAFPDTIREQGIIQGANQAELDRETNLTGYSVTEHYTLRNSRYSTSTKITVAAIYKKGAGKSFQVLSRSGSSALQARVLDRLLQEETDMSHGDARQHALINSANYKMRLIGQESVAGQPCDILELTPLAKSTHLLKGRIWVDEKDHSLVRIEGKPGASPSFFTGRPMIVREYVKTDGFSMAKQSRATTEGFLLGKTDLTIDYSDYKVTRAELNTAERSR